MPHEPMAALSAHRRRIARSACSTPSASPPAAHRHAPSADKAPPPLYTDLGTHQQKITTASPQAQAYFDQGLRLVYASITSRRSAPSARRPASIRRAPCATGASPSPMARTTTARPTRSARTRRSRPSSRRARCRRGPRSASAPSSTRSPRATASTPNADRAALDRAYADAMRDVARRFPDDLDAATLFADAMMNLRPWDLWTPDGKPAARHRGDRRHARAGARGEPESPGREPSLHPRGGGEPHAGARPRRRRPPGRAHARRRAHGPHAVAHLLPGRPLRGRGGGRTCRR